MPARVRPQIEVLDSRDCPAAFGTPWPGRDLTLSFAPDGTDVNGAPSRLGQLFPGTPPAAWQREVLRAFQAWVTSADVNVGVVTDGGQPAGTAGAGQSDRRFGDVRVAAVPLGPDAAALGLPFDVTAGTRSGDVWLNSDLAFTTAGGAGVDLFTVALHEAGHALGLPGSTDPMSALFQELAGPRTGLSAADLQALVDLYGPRSPDRHERQSGNDTTATATEARFGSGGDDVAVRVADLTTPADADVFLFRAENLRGGGVTATVRVAGQSLLVPRLEILDGAGNVLAAGVGAAPGSGDVVLHLAGLTEGEEYFARVTGGPDADFAVGAYALELRPDAADAPDPDEPEEPDDHTNDTPGDATQLDQQYLSATPAADYAVAASLSDAADVDFYEVRSPQSDTGSAGPLTVQVWTSVPGLDPVVDVFDRRGNPVSATVIAHDGGTFTLQVADTLENEDYLVAVRHARPGVGAAAGNYDLGIDFGAPPVALTDTLAGVATGGVAGDAGVTMPRAGVLHLVLTVGPGPAGAVRVSLVDAAGRVLDTRESVAGGTASFNAFLAPGEYRVRAEGGPAAGVAFTVRTATVTDPIGPRLVIPDAIPPVPPTVPPPPVPPAPPAVPPPAPPVVPPSIVPPRVPTVDPVGPTVVAPPAPRPPVRPPLPRTFTAANGPVVRSFNADRTQRFALTPFPGVASVRVAEADFNGDGVADLVVGTGPGAVTRVRVLDGVTLAELFAVDPFEATFTGGVYVAAGDITGDGRADLVITPDEGGGPRVRVFNGSGFGQVADFFGIDDPNFRGGARAAVGDVNGDGFGDLAVAAGFGGGPRVSVLDGRTLAGGSPRQLFADFFAFEEGLRNGAYVALGDTDGDGLADVIAGGGPGGGPRVTVFGAAAQLGGGRPAPTADFFAGDTADRTGARVAAKDFDGDTLADLAVAARAGGPRVIGYRGAALAGAPAALFEADAFPGADGELAVG